MAKKNPGGRPTVMTTETLKLLREAFLMGCTDIEACLYADIGMTALYDYQRNHTEYAKQKEAWKNRPFLKARQNIIEAIERKDREMSRWYMERKKKEEFSLRQEVTGENGAPVQIIINRQ